LERQLRDHGCILHHHGGKHDVWLNPANLQKTSVPRHREIKKGTVRNICRALVIPPPARL
jgi:mRNA interferase HicA